MTHSLGYVLVALPMCLILSGCAGRKHMATTSGSKYPAPTRTVMVADRTGTASDKTLAYHQDVPPAVSPRYNISLEEIRNHMKNGTAVFIDARSSDSYARDHLRGAISLPASHVESQVEQIAQVLPLNKLIIIYCTSSSCGASDMVYEALEAEGFTNMLVFSSGWQALSSARELHEGNPGQRDLALR